MSDNQTHINPLPIPRTQALSIHSQFTLQKALKNYPKHLRILHLETNLSYFLSKRHLKALQRRARSPQALNLEKYLKLPLSFVKSLRHIQSLTLPDDNHEHSFVKYNINWLKRSKKLAHLTFGSIPIFKPSHKTLSQSLRFRFQRAFKNARLHSLTLRASPQILTKSPFIYPRTLRRISIISSDSPTGQALLIYKKNPSHLWDLSTLRLQSLTSFENLLHTLYFLPDPSKLSHLTACLSDDFNYAGATIPKFPEFLAHSLHSLSLNIANLSSVYSLLRSFQNPENLHQLSLQIPMQNSDHLLELALLIVKFQNLSDLAIKNQGFFQYSKIESHQGFFHQISKLVRLKSLKINLQEEKAGDAYEDEYGYLQAFAGCIEALQELQEISFTHSEYDTKEELDLFVAVLKNKGSRIKRLHLDFTGRENEIKYLKGFSKAVKKLKNLEELSIAGSFVKVRYLKRFCKATLKLKWLRSLVLNLKDPNVDLAAFKMVVSEVLMKKGLEEFKCMIRPRINKGSAEEVDSIDIQQVLLKNPRLRKVNICSLIFSSQRKLFINAEAIPACTRAF